jgi:hypothetical protein
MTAKCAVCKQAIRLVGPATYAWFHVNEPVDHELLGVK